MSVHVRKRTAGQVAYEVLWRDPAGKQRCQTFGTRREADARDREIRDLRKRGRYDAVDAGTEPLREAVERWWTDHVECSVTVNTAKAYATCVDRHLLPRLGDVPIRDIQPAQVVALQRDLRDDGVGAAISQKTLMVLSGVMRHSQLLGRIPSNPVQPVKIRQASRQRAIRPISPVLVEQIRAYALERGWERDAALFSTLAYAGLRPGEAFALRWECVGRNTLLIEHGRADGALTATKTNRVRTVRLFAPLAEDLATWRQSTADPDGLVFPRADGEVFRDADYGNWRTRQFDPAAAAVGIPEATPYALRHSFASLLVQAGWNALEISAEMGNSPEVVQRDYSHIFREFARGERIEPEAVIAHGRASATAP